MGGGRGRRKGRGKAERVREGERPPGVFRKRMKAQLEGGEWRGVDGRVDWGRGGAAGENQRRSGRERQEEPELSELNCTVNTVRYETGQTHEQKTVGQERQQNRTERTDGFLPSCCCCCWLPVASLPGRQTDGTDRSLRQKRKRQTRTTTRRHNSQESQNSK